MTTNNYKLALPQQATSNAVSGATCSSLYKELSFPLNVYAHMLWLQHGKVDYLHYGLFQHNKTDLQVAQQYSTKLLMSHLPPPTCRILEIGVGLGATFSLLNKQGYKVHGITPDKQQIAYIHKLLGKQASITCERLEDFQVDAASFDVLLFQESSQYIDPLIIFNKALDLLSPSGVLLIIDEFALKHTEAGTEVLHLLEDMITLAKRFGFELAEQLDLSAMAAPTLDHMLRISMIHRQRLLTDLALSEAQLDRLNQSNRAYQKKYVNGHYGYGLLKFKKKTIPKWRLWQLEQKHEPEILALFEKTFNHAMTPATWRWKYFDEPGHEIGVWQGNQLIAHYGGISRKILFFGQLQDAVQIGDVMVDASKRGVLTKKGAFFLMATTFPERFVGYGKPYLVGFGFPNERAMKVAEKHGLYAEVGSIVTFRWKPLPRWPHWKTRLCPIGHMKSTQAAVAVNECWQQMAGDLGDALVGVRDWYYLRHRYLSHPCRRYQVVLVKNRIGKHVRGVLVLYCDSKDCELIDIIAPLAEIPLLILHARRLAGIAGANQLTCQITENFSIHFAIAGGIKKKQNIRIPATTWSEGPSPETLKNRWWLMSGDMDFK